MPSAPYIDAEGKKASEVELAAEIFDVQVNVPVMHEVVRAQLAAARSGTHSTKTRAEVRGGGRKPWRQKGTGRARHGSIREPSWVGGGVAHGPKPKSYEMRVNKKTRALALRSALTDRVREGKLVVTDLPAFDTPETKRAKTLLSQWGADGKTLIVVDATQEDHQLNAWKSFRNLPEVLIVTYPTAYTVLAADTVVFTKSALDRLSSKPDAVAGGTAKPPADAVPRTSAGDESVGRDESASQPTPATPPTASPIASETPKTDEQQREGSVAADRSSVAGSADSGGSTRPTGGTEAAGTARLEADPEAVSDKADEGGEAGA